MASIIKTRRLGRIALSAGGGIFSRLGFASFAAPRAADELTPDYAFCEVLAGSGGKFTDSLERDADLRLRGSSAAF
jgi:hypothetical protein